MTKGLTIKDAELKHKVNALCVLVFKGLSATEELILCKLIELSINNSLSLSVDISRQIQQDLTISQSSFSTSLHRMVEKKVIAKQGKVVTLNPVFANINELEKLVISFE
jgi:hypothetical protein